MRTRFPSLVAVVLSVPAVASGCSGKNTKKTHEQWIPCETMWEEAHPKK